MVHRKKCHSLSLTLPPAVGGATNCVDQTPTPSRFLGNFLLKYEEAGLNFDDIQKLSPIKSSGSPVITTNPFAETFKKAAKGPSHKVRLVIPPASARSDDSLNTPVPSIHTASTLQMEKASCILTPATEVENASKNQDTEIVQSPSNEETRKTNGVIIRPASALKVATVVSASEKNQNIMPKFVIGEMKTPNPPAIKTYTNIAIQPSKSKPGQGAACTVPQDLSSTNVVKVLSQIKPSYQLNGHVLPKIAPNIQHTLDTNQPITYLLKLPDGQTVQLHNLGINPVNNVKPIAPQVTNISRAPQASTNPRPYVPNIKRNIKTINIDNGNITVNSIIKRAKSLDMPADGSLSPTTSQDSNSSFMHHGRAGRRSKNAPEEDPQEKKQRSLERNREAAMRCRKKRKGWMETLEEKARDLETVNEGLQVSLPK